MPSHPDVQPPAARDAVTACIRAAEASSGLNAFVTIDAERALAQVDGGVGRWCIAVKDNIHVAGLPNTAGTPGLRDFIPTADAPVVARLRAAGAVVIGKTNMHELALGVTSNNPTFGAVANGVDPTRFAGGSSGGTAAAIAVGVVRAGLGTDTGGSVTIPAALSGIYGLRPSVGRYPRDGITPLSSTRDTPGPMAASLDELARLDSIITGDAAVPDLPLPLRIGIPDAFAADLDALVAVRWARGLAALADAGAELVEVASGVLLELDAQCGSPIVFGEFVAVLGRYLRAHEAGVDVSDVLDGIADPHVAAAFRQFAVETSPDHVTPAKLEAALGLRDALRSEYAAIFARAGVHCLACPTTPVPAQPLYDNDVELTCNGRRVPTFDTLVRNTSPGTVAGLPAITLPLPARAPGELPVGLLLTATHGSDRALLGIARRVERSTNPN